MKSNANSVKEYLNEVPDEGKEPFNKLRDTILANLPKGFREEMNYGMIGYVVPHSIYPGGYHCSPELPLPSASIASQKSNIAFYHMGLYSYPELLDWFKKEYPKHTTAKLDMDKSCIRLKKPEQIPFELIGELMKKVSVSRDRVNFYEEKKKNYSK
jgi:hypothetical protein